MKSPSVSVVIPTYNRGNLLVQSVASVLAQTVPAAEILVVDDGSTDDTLESLAPYRDQIRYLPQQNQGVSAARNLGVREACGELVAFLDSDDVWHPRKLELQLKALARHPDLGMIGTRTFDWPAPALPEVAQVPPLDFVSWDRIVVRNPLVTSSLVVRRDLLHRAGPFDTRMQGPEDCDLWLRVAALAPAANLQAPLSGYRHVAGSLSKQAATCRRGMLMILHKLDESGAWQGRRWLRLKAYSYVHHSTAFLFGAAGMHGTAALLAARSLLTYPLPYRSADVRSPWERPKRLILNLLRLVGLKPGEPTPVVADVSEEESMVILGGRKELAPIPA